MQSSITFIWLWMLHEWIYWALYIKNGWIVRTFMLTRSTKTQGNRMNRITKLKWIEWPHDPMVTWTLNFNSLLILHKDVSHHPPPPTSTFSLQLCPFVFCSLHELRTLSCKWEGLIYLSFQCILSTWLAQILCGNNISQKERCVAPSKDRIQSVKNTIFFNGWKINKLSCIIKSQILFF